MTRLGPAGQVSIDEAMQAEILRRNKGLILMALGDAAAWRSEIEDEAAAEVYAALAAELEEWELS